LSFLDAPYQLDKMRVSADQFLGNSRAALALFEHCFGDQPGYRWMRVVRAR
jgi:hypothetical protein